MTVEAAFEGGDEDAEDDEGAGAGVLVPINRPRG